MDLAGAHVVAISRLFSDIEKPQVVIGDPSTTNFEVFNIGTGKGYTVLEVIAAFEAATGEKVPYKIGPRRSGDIMAVWAETSKLTNVLG
jgi:UDP-glucose 4-epimerase